jgi:hypothetical protein
MLLRLDDYRASLEQVESSLRILKANLEVDRKAHEQSILVARADVEKARLDLKTTPVRGAIDAEKLRLAEEEASARLKQLLAEVNFKDVSHAADLKIGELELNESKIELARAQVNADRMLIRAPMNGVTVMSTIVRSGEIGQIQQGDMVFPGQLFMRIVDPSSMIVNASVNQADIEQIRIGARARVRFDAYPDLELPARVYSIGAMPKQGGFRANYVKEVPVVLKLERSDPRVIPDLSASADVVVAREDDAVVAPRESIFQDPGSDTTFAFVKMAAGWERRELELGLASNIAAVVRSGLKPGEVVAVERPPAGNRDKNRTGGS